MNTTQGPKKTYNSLSFTDCLLEDEPVWPKNLLHVNKQEAVDLGACFFMSIRCMMFLGGYFLRLKCLGFIDIKLT